MHFRTIISLSIITSFLILATTGVLSFFSEYTRQVATVHSIFGGLFIVLALLHIWNNFKPLKRYLKQWIVIPVFLGILSFAFASYSELPLFQDLMNWGARSKVKLGNASPEKEYEYFKLNLDQAIQLDFDLLKGQHFWHPQIAIWTEDSLGNYLNTLFVTKATAKGIFAGGRTKANFKSLDKEGASIDDSYRRVDALPVWSHQRGIQYEDGLYAPTTDMPLPDAITGATPLTNFQLATSVPKYDKFVVKLEINVAFDDNEYYSEFDFPDDDIFHNGTGQLGQPSIVFRTLVDLQDQPSYYLMEYEGHGHHSGQTGEIFQETTTLTTALQIVKRIVVGVKKEGDGSL